MRSRSLARWLVIGALASFAVVLGSGIASAQDATTADETLVQGQNGSDDAVSTSGEVVGANAAVIGAGPSAAAGSGSSQSQQNGDNTVVVRQTSTAKSGDAVAGSQVTGVVGGNATVQNQNSSDGAVAVSGAATASNTAAVSAGPSATAVDGSAQAGQSGDNDVFVTQEAEALTGDSVAGSQVTGAVGDAITVQNQNSSDDATSISGAACASFVCGGGNTLFVGAGPSAFSSADPDAEAQAGQVGDNDVVIRQASFAESGDALAGAQVTGIVGNGDASVNNQNSSDFSLAVSGFALAGNVAAVTAGPSATALGLGVGSTAQAAQEGDNDVHLTQVSGSSSGDALAGSQVVGLVSSETGSIEVQNQQSSDFDTAISGSSAAVNLAVVTGGPSALAIGSEAQASQFGDNSVIVTQDAAAATGDALAGSTVVGVVGGSDVTVSGQNVSDFAFATSGSSAAVNDAVVVAGPDASALGLLDAEAQAAQDGDNDVLLSQGAVAESGDAVAGSHVTGVVTDGGDVTVSNQNNADLPLAISGAAVTSNAAVVAAGPSASALAVVFDAEAQVSQVGDNDIDVVQAAESTSGDAVAGSQVTGVVADGGDVEIQNQNNSDLAFATSGAAVAVNDLAVAGGPTAIATALLGDATSQASQDGNTSVVFSQDLVASSGDGVAGSQVAGVVGQGDESAVQQQNSADLPFAVSGAVVGLNGAAGTLGASAISASLAGGDATAQQDGDSDLVANQHLDLNSGDGVSGSQVVGTVADLV